MAADLEVYPGRAVYERRAANRRIPMVVAMLGVELDRVDVSIDSESNDYGIRGLDESVPAGPLSVTTRVSVAAQGTDRETLRELVDWATAHCPVCAKRAVPVSVEIGGEDS